MNAGLLTTHDANARAILDGSKRYEYRAKLPRLDGPTRFLIYVPGPRKELVREMVVSDVLALPPGALLRRTGEHGGIRREAFDAYFEGRDVAYALIIAKARRYHRPKALEEMRRDVPGGFTPPQFLRWVSPSLLAALLA